MSDRIKQVLRWTYHIGITVGLIALGLCLMLACVDIYQSGDHPFTREVVAQHLAPFAMPVLLLLLLLVLGFIIHPLLPDAPEGKADLTIPLLKRLQSRIDLTACPAQLAAAIQRQRRLRRIFRCVALGVFVIGAATFLWYALDVNHFHQSEITDSMISAIWVLLPCVGVPFVCGVAAAYLSHHSQKAEIALLKQAPKEALSPAPASKPMKERWVLVVRYAVLAISVILIVVGLLGNGWLDVLTKAINICTECIGLG